MVPLRKFRWLTLGQLFEVNLFGAATLIRQPRCANAKPAIRHHHQHHIRRWCRRFALRRLVSRHEVCAGGLSSASLRQELNPFGVNVVIVRPEGIKTGWRAIAGATLLANSGDGPYAVAARAMHAKYMSAQFDKMVADPNVVADVHRAYPIGQAAEVRLHGPRGWRACSSR